MKQRKGNPPLPLHSIPKTKICQGCARSKLSGISPAVHIGNDQAPEGRKRRPHALSRIRRIGEIAISDKIKPAPADSETSSHIPICPLYTPADLNARDQEHEVGYPGDYPFTRGVQATMYRG